MLHTYRNSQELIDIAGSFVQKNTTQIKKQLVSPKRLQNPIQLEFYDDGTKAYKNLAGAVNNAISKILNEFGEKKSILLLGRYNFDMYNLLMTNEFKELHDRQLKSIKFPQARLSFMTISFNVFSLIDKGISCKAKEMQETSKLLFSNVSLVVSAI